MILSFLDGKKKSEQHDTIRKQIGLQGLMLSMSNSWDGSKLDQLREMSAEMLGLKTSPPDIDIGMNEVEEMVEPSNQEEYEAALELFAEELK